MESATYEKKSWKAFDNGQLRKERQLNFSRSQAPLSALLTITVGYTEAE